MSGVLKIESCTDEMSFDQIAWLRRKITSKANGKYEGQQFREKKVELINLNAGESSSKAEDVRASIGRMVRIAHWLIHDDSFRACRCDFQCDRTLDRCVLEENRE